MAEQKKPAKKKVYKKNYYLKGFGPVGKGSEPTPEQRQSKDYSDKLLE
jgi:hypothetical protein